MWKKIFGTRRRWAWIAALSLLAAAVVEAIQHPLAGFLCDVPGDPWAALGLLVLGIAPLLSEWTLAREENLNAVKLARTVNGAAWTFFLALLVAVWPMFLLAGIGLWMVPFSLLGAIGGGAGGSEALLFALYPLLAFSPLVTAIVLLCQHIALRKIAVPRLRKPLWWTVFAALCLWAFRPLLLGYHIDTALKAEPGAREKSLAILRVIGGEYDLRMLAYQRHPTFSYWLSRGGALSELNGHNRWSEGGDPLARARRTYYLLTGQPYTAAPVPPPQVNVMDRNDLLKIEEQGGAKVGSKVDGVTLSSSLLEAQVEPQTGTARTLWTMTFANASAEGEEARATVRLPENAVISGVWLWIKGEKRPAAFGGKAQVRAAYEQVVKIERRDPLLVTTTDPRRALVQCFPVPPKGEMQIQLEVTQALDGDALALPALTDTNFAQPDSLRHRVKVSGNGPEQARALTEVQMLQPAPIITPSPNNGERAGGNSPIIGGQGVTTPVDLTVAIDTTADVQGWVLSHSDWLAELEKRLPPGSTVRYADTRLPQPTETTQLADVRKWRYAGGVDGAPALAALGKRAAKSSAILWIHGPMPEEATDLHPLHLIWQEENALRLLGVLVKPGPDPVMDGLANYKTVWVKDGATPENVVRTAATPNPTDAQAISEIPLGGRWPAKWSLPAVARIDWSSDSGGANMWLLYDWSRVMKDWYAGQRTDDLARYAASRRLVTPISGAVVLESLEQYKQNGLDPNKAPDDPNPQVSSLAPEPSALALVLLALPFACRGGKRGKRAGGVRLPRGLRKKNR